MSECNRNLLWQMSECNRNLLWQMSECNRNLLWQVSECNRNLLWQMSERNRHLLWQMSECNRHLLWQMSECNKHLLWQMSECNRHLLWQKAYEGFVIVQSWCELWGTCSLHGWLQRCPVQGRLCRGRKYLLYSSVTSVMSSSMCHVCHGPNRKSVFSF